MQCIVHVFISSLLQHLFLNCRIVAFRLSSSNENRLADSSQSLTNTLNDMCFSCMEKLTAAEAKQLSNLKEDGILLPNFYSFFVRQVWCCAVCTMES